MNLDYYRKARGKEPIVINLDSDEEHPHNTPILLVKSEHNDPLPAPQPQSIPTSATQTKSPEGPFEAVVEYDESSNSYEYSYSYEPKSPQRVNGSAVGQ